MSLFASFTTNPTITINLNNQEGRLRKTIRVQGGDPIDLPVYSGNENVSGTVDISVPPGKKIEHQGTYPFEFSTEKPYESYSGMNVRLRYFIRVTITRNYSNCVKEQEFLVQNYANAATQAVNQDTAQQGIKMEVGIEDCLHIEFEFDKQRYHLQDVILGKIYFLLVRIKIKFMELAVIRREAAGVGPNSYNESENIVKFELMDGAPIKGECVPIRLFLSHLDLTPTYRSVNNVFSVKYYLNLVLVDEEDRRYFKQQEVVFWRRADEQSAVPLEGGQHRGLRMAPDRMVNV
eukprot:gene655-459_t